MRVSFLFVFAVALCLSSQTAFSLPPVNGTYGPCDPKVIYLFGCEPIVPIYHVKGHFIPDNGPVSVAYSFKPYPLSDAPTTWVGTGPCSGIKQDFSGSQSSAVDFTQKFAKVRHGSSATITNKGANPISVSLAGDFAVILNKDASQEFSFVSDAADGYGEIDLPLFRVWAVGEINGVPQCKRAFSTEKQVGVYGMTFEFRSLKMEEANPKPVNPVKAVPPVVVAPVVVPASPIASPAPVMVLTNPPVITKPGAVPSPRPDALKMAPLLAPAAPAIAAPSSAIYR